MTNTRLGFPLLCWHDLIGLGDVGEIDYQSKLVSTIYGKRVNAWRVFYTKICSQDFILTPGSYHAPYRPTKRAPAERFPLDTIGKYLPCFDSSIHLKLHFWFNNLSSYFHMDKLCKYENKTLTYKRENISIKKVKTKFLFLTHSWNDFDSFAITKNKIYNDH